MAFFSGVPVLGDVESGLSGFGTKPKRTRTTDQYSTSGSELGEGYAKWGLDRYQKMMDPTAYTGSRPGEGGPTTGQVQEWNILSGMKPGAITGAVGNMTPQEIADMNRKGGPDEGYFNPYRKQMKQYMEDDYGEALAMMENQIGSGARGANAFGGGRHGVASGVGGAKAMDAQAYENAMQWQREDARDRSSDITAMNQANLGFGDLRRRTAVDQGTQDFGKIDRFSRYGLNQQDQRDKLSAFDYGEFNRMHDWERDTMDRYMRGVASAPWQTTTTGSTTQTGQGKSPFEQALGLGMGFGGMAMAGGWKPFS